MDWKEKAINILRDSLYPISTELNELDWKSGLSCKTERLAKHISAMSNQKGGGILVFGIEDDGSFKILAQEEIKDIIQKLGNIAKNNLCYPIAIEHSVINFEGHDLLFIFIPEQIEKPVYLKGKNIFDSYHRSAGQTVRMSKNQVRIMISESNGVSFEKQIAKSDISKGKILEILNYKTLYHLIDRNIPSSTDSIINKMIELGFCKENHGTFNITNLGAILLANDMSLFPSLNGREIIVRKYIGTNNRHLQFEQHGKYGYAVGFEELIDFIINNTSVEDINLKRNLLPIYPIIAIREFVANALVHQDFTITGANVTIEIYANKLVITNPGTPLNDINRLIDLPPRSRNEDLAQTMFLLNICERRGSGIDRAVEAIEKMYLPAVLFKKSEDYTRVFMYPQKTLSDMTKQEKILACYQHACLKYEDNESINNQSVRERFNLNKRQTSVASRIIADTLEEGLIKISNTDIVSKKYATYYPFYG